MKRSLAAVSISLAAGVALACNEESTGPVIEPAACNVFLSQFQEVGGDTVTTASGLKYVVLETGTGSTATQGKVAAAHYAGYLTSGSRFDTSCPTGFPFAFTVGAGQVIPGFEEGIAGMRVGGIRRLIVPPSLAYGSNPPPNSSIPADATLIFDVELIDVL